MFLNKKLAVAVSGAVLLMAGQFALADSTTDIVDALVSKGVLTEEEGKLISKGHETKKKAEGTVTFKDGFKMNSGDGKSSMSIVGRVQLDSRQYGWGSGSSGGDKINDTFDVRRAYLGAKGTFKKYYDWEVTADFAGLTGGADSFCSSTPTVDGVAGTATCSATAAGKTSTVLDVAYLNVNYWDKKAMFQFGQFKMPYSLEERTSSRFIDFQERSFMNNTSLTPAKERGFMVWGTPFTGINYALAFSTGQGKNTNDYDNKEDGKDIIVHADANIAEIMGNKEAIIHVGGSYTNGDLPIAGTGYTTVGKQRTEGRGYEFFSVSNFTVPVERTRYGFESVLAYGPVKFQGEYSKANFEGVGIDKDLDASYVSALWMITGEKYADNFKGGKFDRITPKNEFNPDDLKNLGAIELGVRYSKFDGKDLVTASSTIANDVDSYTAGIKWIPSANARFMVNYVRTDFNRNITYASRTQNHEDALLMRAQYDF